MTVRAPFNPGRGSNQIATMAANTPQSLNIDTKAKSYRIINLASQVVHVRVGPGAQTASIADTPVNAGATAIFSKGEGEDTMSLFSTAGTGPVHVQTGEGGI